jgi:hypothetical protein
MGLQSRTHLPDDGLSSHPGSHRGIDALFAGKVQRKVSNGVTGFAAARSSLDRHEIAAIPAISAIDQHPRKKGC